MSEYLEEIREDFQSDDTLREHAPKLALLIGILFWLVVPQGIAVVLSQDALTANFPLLGTVGSVLLNLCMLAYAAALLKLKFASPLYQKAGLCSLAAFAINLVMVFLQASLLTTVLVLAVVAITLGLSYFELHGHAEILRDLDPVRSEKFRELWKMNITAHGAACGGMVLMMFVPFFGAIVLLTGLSGVVFVAIKKLIYLNRLWKLLRNYE